MSGAWQRIPTTMGIRFRRLLPSPPGPGTCSASGHSLPAGCWRSPARSSLPCDAGGSARPERDESPRRPALPVPRPEDLVARVAQARQDVADLVEALVDRGRVDLDIRVAGFKRAQAFRGRDQEQAL